MPIQLISGTPGAGKTTLALELLCEAAGIKPRDYKTAEALIEALRECTPPRPIFTWNVTGLVDGLPFKPMEDVLDWEQLPDGALILGDEAWERFGTQTEAKKDPRALNLAKHRHRGFDFIFTVQHPSQLTTFLRSLVGEHVHVSRRFGTKVTQRFTWSGCCDDPNGLGNRKRGSEVVWTHHRPVQGLYRSATIHTVQRKLPARVLALPVLALAAFGALYFGATKVKAFTTEKPEPAALAQRSEQAPAGLANQPGQPQPQRPMTAAEWAERVTPRIAGVAWSAPVFDGRPAVSEPRTFCWISYKNTDVGQCKCVTEQGSRLSIDRQTCVDIAENGEPYNPFRREGRILATDSGRPEHPERQDAAPRVISDRRASSAVSQPGAVIAAPEAEPTASWGAGA